LRTDVEKLRELSELTKCEKAKCFTAELLDPGEQWPLQTKLDNVVDNWFSDNPWCIEDWPEFRWKGNYSFHKYNNTIYLVEGALRDFNGSIYRPRLRGFQEMVSWASPAPVGFTTLGKITEKWGYILISPWLIGSTDNRWLQRIKLFAALNEFDPVKWPMSLLLSRWDIVRKIMF